MKRASFLALLACVCPALVAKAADDIDRLKATVEAMEARIREQDRRIAELEARQETQKVEQKKFLELAEEIRKDAAARSGPDFNVYWKDGVRLDTADGRVKMRLGGRLQQDVGWIDGSGIERDMATDLEDGAEIRRAFLTIQGTIDDALEFKWEYDFAAGSAVARDIYLKFLKVPLVGSVTVGHFREPFSLEELTSSNYTTFLERALPNVLAPSRNIGVMLMNSPFQERMTWAVGVFRETDDTGRNEADDGYALTARATALPWYQDKGRRLLHLGAGYSYREMEDSFRYRQRPEAHWISQRFTDTGSIAAAGANLFNGEVAMVCGPFSVQGEYFAANLDAQDLGHDLCFNGFYVQASYFLTGEHRPYRMSDGVFDRVRPAKNYRGGKDGGWGAWEVAARYSYLDLGDRDLPDTATRVQDATVGLNWYLNPNMKLMWNYIRSCVDGAGIANGADIFMMRAQVDF